MHDYTDRDEGFELKTPRWGFALQNRGFEYANLGKKKDEQKVHLFSWLGLVVVFQEELVDYKTEIMPQALSIMAMTDSPIIQKLIQFENL